MNKDEARNELLRMIPLAAQGPAVIVTQDGAGRGETAGAAEDGKPELSRVLGELSSQVALMGAASRAVESALEANTRATVENTQSQGSGGGREALSKAGSGLASWFGLSPIAWGLQALLGREKAPDAGPALSRYEAAPALRPALHPYWGVWESGATAGAVSHGQLGLARPAAQSAPLVTVQVSAMDSRSFLDNSENIARAVREAILNSRALADVVGEY
jgi:hypothetical protein